jgi:hypothetical protein
VGPKWTFRSCETEALSDTEGIHSLQTIWPVKPLDDGFRPTAAAPCLAGSI